jgi:hypothetical protein
VSAEENKEGSELIIKTSEDRNPKSVTSAGK